MRDKQPPPRRIVRFEDTVPYAIPASLDDLRGPTTGTVHVRPYIDPLPSGRVYDLSEPWQVDALYRATVRYATLEDLVRIL